MDSAVGVEGEGGGGGGGAGCDPYFVISPESSRTTVTPPPRWEGEEGGMGWGLEGWKGTGRGKGRKMGKHV